MNLKNISCDPKTVLRGEITPHVCVKFSDFFVIYQKLFNDIYQKLYIIN